jgi:hypothetical protein
LRSSDEMVMGRPRTVETPPTIRLDCEVRLQSTAKEDCFLFSKADGGAAPRAFAAPVAAECARQGNEG